MSKIYVIAKQDNEPVFVTDGNLEAALDRLGMDRGRFVHQGGTPFESAPLYKSNGWLAGCIFLIHTDGALDFAQRVHNLKVLGATWQEHERARAGQMTAAMDMGLTPVEARDVI